MTDSEGASGDSRSRWEGDRTTFQRVYDVLVGTTDPTSAEQFAERANCSANGARRALSQLVEMGIAEAAGSRPTTYRRNPAYVRWKRVETLAREHDEAELRGRLDELLAADREFQERYEVPAPDAVAVADSVEDHESLHERWDDVTEWRTVRRDVDVLSRAVRRAGALRDDRARA